MIDLPEVLILSTQRSGTHLLESFLKNHPCINGRGELFLRYARNLELGVHDPQKINVAILMYNQVEIFKSLGGNLANFKIIHLLRKPESIALSRCQMLSDKNTQGAFYTAHLKTDMIGKITVLKRTIPALEQFEKFQHCAEGEQKLYQALLSDQNHLQINYEEFVPKNVSIENLTPAVAKRISKYLDIEEKYLALKTSYIKTGIVQPRISGRNKLNYNL